MVLNYPCRKECCFFMMLPDESIFFYMIPRRMDCAKSYTEQLYACIVCHFRILTIVSLSKKWTTGHYMHYNKHANHNVVQLLISLVENIGWEICFACGKFSCVFLFDNMWIQDVTLLFTYNTVGDGRSECRGLEEWEVLHWCSGRQHLKFSAR